MRRADPSSKDADRIQDEFVILDDHVSNMEIGANKKPKTTTVAMRRTEKNPLAKYDETNRAKKKPREKIRRHWSTENKSLLDPRSSLSLSPNLRFSHHKLPPPTSRFPNFVT